MEVLMTFPVRGFFVLAFLCLWMAACPAWAGHGAELPPRPAILLVAFGTTVPEARTALEHLEAQVRQRYPGVEVRWAYTARQVREKIRTQGVVVDSPALALARLADDGFTHVAVQSLHVIPGEEFHNLLTICSRMEGLPKGLRRITVGAPLVATSADVRRLAAALTSRFADRNRREAVVFFGHGTAHGGDVFYSALDRALQQVSPWFTVTTVEGTPSMDETVQSLAALGATQARLVPLMAVAGDHALNDMSGDDPESLASRLRSRGIKPVPVLEGLASSPEVSALWMEHLARAWGALELL
jgi:sirohydrochlorin cobaltochelatase